MKILKKTNKLWGTYINVMYKGKKHQRYYENPSGYLVWSAFEDPEWVRLDNLNQIENDYQQTLLNNKRRERLKRILK